MPQIEKEEQAEIFERAIEKWMDKKFAIFGKWTATGICVAVFGYACLYLFAHGWRPS